MKKYIHLKERVSTSLSKMVNMDLSLKKGEMVIPCQYEDALFFSDGIAIVCQEGKYGAINKIGEMIIPFQYDYSLKH